MSEYEVPLFILCYDGVTDPPADPPADPLATPPATPPAPDAKFTQNDLNKILAEERRKADAKVKSLLGEKQVHIDKLLEMKNLTEQERAALQTEKEELQRQLLTKEERLKAEKKAVEDTLNAKVKEIETKATAWEQRYVASSIKREFAGCRRQGRCVQSGPVGGHAETHDHDGAGQGRLGQSDGRTCARRHDREGWQAHTIHAGAGDRLHEDSAGPIRQSLQGEKRARSWCEFTTGHVAGQRRDRLEQPVSGPVRSPAW